MKQKLALIVTDSSKDVKKALSEFNKKMVIQELGRDILKLDKDEAKVMYKHLQTKPFVMINDADNGRNKIRMAFGYLIALGIGCKIVKENEAIKKTQKWIFEGVEGITDEIKKGKLTCKRNFLKSIEAEPKAFRELMKQIIKKHKK